MGFSKVLSEGDLRSLLGRLDGRRYGAYKRLRGVVFSYDFGEGIFTRIQGDPYAPPSVMEVTIPPNVHRLPSRLLDEKNLTPLLDYLARLLYSESVRLRERCGTGNSGYLGIPRPGPCVLRRSCVEASGKSLIFRFFVGLPARGRRILGGRAAEILLDRVPELFKSIMFRLRRIEEVEERITLYLDQEYIRRWLYESDHIAFVGDGSILPRESSYSPKPLRGAIPFKAPEGLEVSLRLPSGRVITGMALPREFITITGGGYHGKTTLLKAIQEGIYNHVKGDGREYVIARRGTILVRAEDGRLVSHVDISSFIEKLPAGRDTSDFSSLCASGSTSMAASMSEAIEMDAEVILIDEDTSATNLLYKDEAMTRIIREEPIKPLSMQGEAMVSRCGIGIVAVAGASSALVSAADKVILMENYVPREITEEARRIAPPISVIEYKPPRKRVFYGIRGLRKVKLRGFKLIARYENGESFELDLSNNPRIVEKAQANLIAHIVASLRKPDEPMYVSELVRWVNLTLRERGFEAFVKPVTPDLALVDGIDVVWTLNRLRNASFSQ